MSLDLRPLSIGELFDRAFMLYRRHFWLFVGITAVPGVFALIMTLTQQGLQTAVTVAPGAASQDSAAMISQVGTIVLLVVGMMVALVIYSVVYVIALGATTFAVSELYVGRPASITQVYSRMRGRIGRLILLMLLIALRLAGLGLAAAVAIGVAAGAARAIGAVGGAAAIVGALAAIVLMIAVGGAALFMMLRYAMAVPALVLEGLSARNSIRRSIELTRGRLGRVFLLILCATMVSYAAMILLQGPFFAGALVSGMDTTRGFWLTIVGTVAGTVGGTLTSPFMVIGLALLYYDARIREEGFDLQLALGALDVPADTARV
jgi:membrane-anchored glycerophosphoryl diester phosphodiesterase (GDPDase)